MGRRKKKPKMIMYLTQLSLEEGMQIIVQALKNRKEKLFVMGHRVKRDFPRFQVLASVKLKCHFCGRKPTHFIIEQHVGDIMGYQLNLYSGTRMMTWDHIVPRALGGSDDTSNARCACSSCNMKRAHHMTIKEMLWTNTQDPSRIFKQDQRLPISMRVLLQYASLCGEGLLFEESGRIESLIKSDKFTVALSQTMTFVPEPFKRREQIRASQ